MAVTKMLFKTWSVAVSTAASECVNATLGASLPTQAYVKSGTAVDSKGNVWFTSFNGPYTSTDSSKVVIWMCPEDGGECVQKRTSEDYIQYTSREIAVHASDAVSVVYLLLRQPTGPARVKTCAWDNNNLEQEVYCSLFVESSTDSHDNHLALDQQGNVFLSHVSYADEKTHYLLRKCNSLQSGFCMDFGGDFWESHGFAPAYVAFDSQDNLYATRKPGSLAPGFPVGYTVVAKCTAAGECTETQITSAGPIFAYEEIAVSPDDNIYMMVHYGVNTSLAQCSPDGVCNHGVVTFNYNETMTGLSAGKHGDLYTHVTPHLSSQPNKVIRVCVPPQMNDIQV